ncbi:PREDICTED: probable cytochrome P450 9f2 [Papilio xuthus]|uniref:unspecific monooxygenase n=1 Tax=Papilio xuthus TaxID=66420 RepID=A0AAJ7ED40_PAPXU|nr:PREDICTED: probable cytochrome P450 9f2 [Papilio xuthus]
MIVEILIFILTSILVYFIYTYKRVHYYFEEKGLKYNPGVPIFGNIIRSTFLRKHFVEDIDTIYKEFPNEKYVGYIEAITPVVLIRDPEIIKHITVKDFDHFVNHKDFFPEEIEPLFGSSLLLMKDNKWRDMRTTLSPTFTGSKMRHMLPFMIEISNNMVNYLKDHTNKDLDVSDLMRRYTNDVIASTAFGIQVNSVQNKDNDFYKTGQAMFNMSAQQKFKFFFVNQFPALSKLLRLRIFEDKYTKFFENIVTTTMEHRETHNIQRPDIIQLLMQAYKGNLKAEDGDSKDEVVIEAEKLKRQSTEWSQRELASQVFIFFLAGFETSATALTMCIHELAINPTIQDRLYEEIKTFKEKHDRLTCDNISDMKYLDCVINETLRRWAPALIMDRVCTKAYELPPPHEGGKPCKLNPGDVVYNVVNSLHLDPNHYPDPEVFDPDRFSDDRKHEIKPFTFMPFGIGPRVCIGSRFALLELKVLIYDIVLNFNILKCEKTTDPITLEPHDFNIKAAGGTWVNLERRC